MNVNDSALLLVEDDPDQIFFVQEALKASRLLNPLHVVRNGEDALAYLSGKGEYADRRQHPLPSILILDLKLPRVAGLDVLEWLRGQVPFRELPVVVLTSSSDPRDIRRAHELGVHSYLAKPVDSQGIADMMKSLGLSWVILRGNPGSEETKVAARPNPARVIVLDEDEEFLSALSSSLLEHNPPFIVYPETTVRDAFASLMLEGCDAFIYDPGAVKEGASSFLNSVHALRPQLPLLQLPEGEGAPPAAGPGPGKGRRSPLGRRCDEVHAALVRALGRAGAPAAPAKRTPAAPPPHAPLARPRGPDTEILGHRVHFQETSWDMVRSARNVEALDGIIRIYWKPLYFFVRQKGYSNEAAKDVVQEFLTQVLQRGTILKADAGRGKFRTFLLASLTNFMKDRARGEGRMKRGGGQQVLSLDFEAGEREYSVDFSSGEAPETAIDRAWARNLLSQSIASLKAPPAHLKAFQMLMEGADYAKIIKETGLTGPAAKTAISRLRQQLRDILLEYVSKTSSCEEEAEEELADFVALLQDGSRDVVALNNPRSS